MHRHPAKSSAPIPTPELGGSVLSSTKVSPVALGPKARMHAALGALQG